MSEQQQQIAEYTSIGAGFHQLYFALGISAQSCEESVYNASPENAEALDVIPILL